MTTNPALTKTTIDSLHPYHHYNFSIAAFTVAMGPFASQTTQMPEAGNIILYLNILNHIISLFYQYPQAVPRLSTVEW